MPINKNPVDETRVRILKDPKPTIAVFELGDSSVNLVCRPWVKPQYSFSAAGRASISGEEIAVRRENEEKNT